MDTFSRHDLDTLLRQPPARSVSLHLPTHRAGDGARQDPIAFGNLIGRAEAELAESGLRRPEVLDILGPARRLATDPEFWRDRGDGLAVFLRPGWWRAFRLPLPLGEAVTVADRFHVYPLLPLLAGHDEFSVLALSENEARLYDGDRWGIRPVPVPGLPHGVKDALRYDEPLKQRGHHLGVRIGAKERTVVHGQGIGGEVQKERLGRYLHTVSHAVDAVLAGQHRPLVLAGVDHIRAAYRETTGYRHVLTAGIPGSPDRVPPAELHSRAWELVAPVAARAEAGAVTRYENTAGTGLASDDLGEVETAAGAGRVEVLFVSSAASPAEQPRCETAAVGTLRSGGTVHVVPTAGVPGRSPLAALFRY